MNKTPFFLLLPLVLCLFFQGCAKKITYDTPSKKPEVTIKETSIDSVVGAISNEMINMGYTITNPNSRMLVFERPADNIMVSILLGSEYNSEPNVRVTYSINELKKQVRVVASFCYVANPGSAFEKIQPMDGAKGTDIFYNMLLRVKKDLEQIEN